MSIQDRLSEEMKAAMKSRDSLRLGTIRMARTALKNAEIEARRELDEATTIKVLSTLVKQRREAAEAYRATRCDLLVMGAYSRSHLRERILGGVTHYMLTAADIPVFALHV